MGRTIEVVGADLLARSIVLAKSCDHCGRETSLIVTILHQIESEEPERELFTPDVVQKRTHIPSADLSKLCSHERVDLCRLFRSTNEKLFDAKYRSRRCSHTSGDVALKTLAL